MNRRPESRSPRVRLQSAAQSWKCTNCGERAVNQTRSSVSKYKIGPEYTSRAGLKCPDRFSKKRFIRSLSDNRCHTTAPSGDPGVATEYAVPLFESGRIAQECGHRGQRFALSPVDVGCSLIRHRGQIGCPTGADVLKPQIPGAVPATNSPVGVASDFRRHRGSLRVALPRIRRALRAGMSQY